MPDSQANRRIVLLLPTTQAASSSGFFALRLSFPSPLACTLHKQSPNECFNLINFHFEPNPSIHPSTSIVSQAEGFVASQKLRRNLKNAGPKSPKTGQRWWVGSLVGWLLYFISFSCFSLSFGAGGAALAVVRPRRVVLRSKRALSRWFAPWRYAAKAKA